jgi:gas vesicle protein
VRRFENQEETPRLGGEAQVYPRMGERRPVALERLLSGSMLLLAGFGIGRLDTRDWLSREHGHEGEGTPDILATPGERSRIMELRRKEDSWLGGRMDNGVGVVTLLASCGFGFMVGEAATLLTTPESGVLVRNRIKRGINRAKKKIDKTVAEAKQDWSAVGDDISDSLKRTASRAKRAAEVTREALTSCDEPDSMGRRVS